LQDGSPLPDHLRPDLSGAIVKLDKEWQGHKVIMAMPVGEKIPQGTLDWLMNYARDQLVPLLYGENLFEDGEYSGWKQLGFGPPEFARAVKETIGQDDIWKL